MAEDITPAKSTLLGYSLNKISIEGQTINENFLKPELQPSVGTEAYEIGCKILSDYFKKELKGFLCDELDPKGKKIIEMFLNDATVKEFEKIIDGESVIIEN